MKQFNKILIANRGEIAVRIIRSARELGYATVAVYSDADSNALHVQQADQAVYIGESISSRSYLDIKKIIHAANSSGAGAIHPAYGFLSENEEFALACEKADIVFIGPSADVINLMGSKRQAKNAMISAGVPCIPGYQGSNQKDKQLLEEARQIGFPLMIKASAGGGGRGMRLVSDESEFKNSLQIARSEALSAFGNDELILEKALVDARHVEIQVFADGYGNTIHLGERDCSVQRRHQKVVEEAPSPRVNEDLRARMGSAAVDAAQSCSYVGAGTVEFLLAENGEFYFLEMNTRLQVEHPVTELISGIDLVAWQIMIAAGEKLPIKQDEVNFKGHAIEVRLYAEDPNHEFLPQTGEIVSLGFPENENIRIDSGIYEGQLVSPYYDPLLAKIISFGETREASRRQLIHALRNTVLLGVKNNKRFLCDVLEHQEFAMGDANTSLIEQHFANYHSQEGHDSKTLTVAAALTYLRVNQSAAYSTDLVAWSNSNATVKHYLLQSEGLDYEIELEIQRQGDSINFKLREENSETTIDILSTISGNCVFKHQSVRESAEYIFQEETLFIQIDDEQSEFKNVTFSPALNSDVAGTGRITAPMDGLIVDVLVNEGGKTVKGQTIMVMEAMKMEHQLTTDIDGVVDSVLVKNGDQVKLKQLLASVTD